MGYPKLPDIKPDIDLKRSEVIKLILASIGLEELSLAHMINTEAEKVQKALGTLQKPGTGGYKPSHYFYPIAENLEELLAVNRSVEKMMKFLVHKEFLLLVKLEDILGSEESDGNDHGHGNGNGNGHGECCVHSIDTWRKRR